MKGIPTPVLSFHCLAACSNAMNFTFPILKTHTMLPM